MKDEEREKEQGQAADETAGDLPAPLRELEKTIRQRQQESREYEEARRRRYEQTVAQAAAALRGGGEALWELARLTYENTAFWIKGPEYVGFSQWVDDVRKAAGVDFDEATAWKYRTVWHHVQPIQNELRELLGLPLHPHQPAGPAGGVADGEEKKSAAREPFRCGESGCPGKVISNWHLNTGYYMADYFGCDRGHITLAQVGGHRSWDYCHFCWGSHIVEEFAPFCSPVCREVGLASERLLNLYHLLELRPGDADPKVMADLVDHLWPPRPEPPRRSTH
jgi:hypothetical protein